MIREQIGESAGASTGAPASNQDAGAPGRPPRTLAFLLLLVIPAILGLVSSAILAIDYIQPLPVFCTGGGGCGEVRKTAFAAFFGVPTPFFGLIAFASLLGLALFSGRRTRVVHWMVALMAALVAAFFIVVQIRIGAFCKYCMAADLSSLVLLVGAVLRRNRAWDLAAGWKLRSGVASGGLLAVAAPILIGFHLDRRVPDVILEEIAQTPKGLVTIVDFADFECPHCRLAHEKLSAALLPFRDKVRVVRKHVPLERIHTHARDAACAGICAEAQGKGDLMAERLFTEREWKLTRDGCVEFARNLNLDLGKFQTCTDAPSTRERIEKDTGAFHDARGIGLPTIWIDREVFRGSQQSTEAYAAAVKRGLSKL